MAESFFFMFLILIGGIATIISFFILLYGLINDSKKHLIRGAKTLIFPAICFGLIFGYYDLYIPNVNKDEELRFEGLYKARFKNLNIENNREVFLILKKNNLFTLDSTPGINFSGQGKWKAGGIDGSFDFMNMNEKLLGWGSPVIIDGREKLIFNQNDSTEVIFEKTEK